jgi:hypothetical protein
MEAFSRDNARTPALTAVAILTLIVLGSIAIYTLLSVH